MERVMITRSVDETRELGKSIALGLRPQTLVCLRGELGAGKTAFVQGVLEGLGAQKPYVSPTFVIMKQYDLPEATASSIRRIYHCDAYRVAAKDFEELGFAEWCADPEGLTLLEWPERVATLLPSNRIDITFKSLSETEREISVVERN